MQSQINQIIAPSGEAPSAAEVQNARIGADGVTYDTLGGAIRGQVTDLKSAINELESNTGEITTLEDFRSSQKINKGIDGITFLLVNRTGNNVITNNTLIYAEHDLLLDVKTGYMYIVATFSSGEWATENHIANTPWLTGEYFVPKGTWFTVQIMKTDRSAFANGEADKVVVTVKDLLYSDDLTITDLNNLTNDYALRRSQKINYFINGITFLLEEQYINNTITTTEILYANHKTICKVESGYKYFVATYTSDVWATENHIASTPWLTGEYIIPKGTYYAIQLRRSDNSVFAHFEADKYVFTLQELAYLDDLGERPLTLYHILVTGQSLGVGAEGNPALTTTTPYEYIGKAYQFNGGSRPIDGMENDTGVEEIAILDKCLDYFGSLCEETHILNLGSGEDARHAYRGETISSAMGYWFNKLTNKKVLVSNHSFGGKSYNGLKKGSIAYGNSIRAVHHAKAICDRLGWNYVVYAVAVVHGEADLSGGVSADTYKGYLNQWQSDYDADIKAITGQAQDVQMFVSQTAAASAYNMSVSPVPNGVFLASIDNSNIHLVAPQYCFPLTYASVHMNNYGYRALGEIFGYHIGRRFNGSFNTCLYPIKSEISGTKITLTFNNNDIINLVYDGLNVAEVSDGYWGFELIDSGSNATISNVAIVNNKVEITLSEAPSANAYISYAYKVLSDEMGKIGSTQGVRGNLRSGWAFKSIFTGLSIPQWCAIFSIPVSWQA